ncbi:MAG: Helix-turn-helix domain protein [Mucilaginibacter sp.]|nr:Helix-turn-helix domain protein [Mucilaginibacter sp.]
MNFQTFGEYIKHLREQKNYPLRKVAAALDIDPSTLSKIEKGDRVANKGMISHLASFFDVESEDLNLILISDKVALELVNEVNAEEIIKAATEKIKYLKAKNVEQGTLNFIHD